MEECLCLCVCMHGEARRQLWGSLLQIPSPLSWTWGLSPDWNSPSGRGLLARSSRELPVFTLGLVLQEYTSLQPVLFYVGSGDQIQAFTLARQALYWVSCLPSPLGRFFDLRSLSIQQRWMILALNEALCLGAHRLIINITTWWKFSVDGEDAHSARASCDLTQGW